VNGLVRALLYGKDREIPDGAVTAFEFARLPRGAAALALVILLLGLVAGVVWIYRREGSASPRAKATLATLRALTLLALVLVLLEPVLAVDQVETVQKTTVVLVDGSLSMTTRDRYRDALARARLEGALGVEPHQTPRIRLVNLALRASSLVAQLARNNPVEVFRFAASASPFATFPRAAAGSAPAPLPEIVPAEDAGKGTDLVASLRHAVERVGADRVAAVILFSDGRATLGAPPEDLAAYLRNKDLRLFTVCVGEAQPQPNLRAVALAGPDRIFRRDPALFEAKVSGRAVAGAEVLFERRFEGEEEWAAVERKAVAFPSGEGLLELRFLDRPQKTGRAEYRVRLEPAPEESSERDNAKTFRTEVVDEKALALLVAGGPAHEYYAVKNVLLRDPTIRLACFLQSADAEFAQDGNDVSLERVPGTEEELFRFDVVILHDPDAARLPPGFFPLLARFVGEHGGGLVFVAGERHTRRVLRGEGGAELTDLLPVVLDLDRADTPEGGVGFGRAALEPWRAVPEPAAFSHPATRFGADAAEARERIWRNLPPFYWHFPVLCEKPGATVLARHPTDATASYGRRPLLAVHRFGAGYAMFLASDETHRWRSTAEPIFDRFWVQSARFLLEGRMAGERKRFRVFLDAERYDLGDAVEITAEAFDEKFRPLEAASVPVKLAGPDGREDEVTLFPAEGRPGTFIGSYSPSRVGEYVVQGMAPFSVSLPDREMGDVRADPALLEDLARRTRGFSAGLHELHRLADPALIPPATERIVTSGRPVPLWDTWTTVIVVLALLCAEWILRKRHRMV